MEGRGLYDLIGHLERGTKLHIGVLFFGNHGNELCRLPHKHKIHSSEICETFKSGHNAYRRCFRCRNMALKKALETKTPFGGICSNGIYEYTHPVVVSGEVAAVIFIGNILLSGEENPRLSERIGARRALLETMEKNVDLSDAKSIAGVIEEYILLLFMKGGEKRNGDGTLIENIKSYIRSNMEFDINTSHVAAVFHYNKSYLGRLFKQETGISISEYLGAERIERAKGYLAKTDMTVLEIAEKCGFSRVGYFNRLFRAACGTTPTEYRREMARKSKFQITK